MDNTTWWGVIIKNGLAALVMLTALYLLYVGYKFAMNYLGGRRIKEMNIKYPELHLSEKEFFENTLEAGVEVHEKTAIDLEILDTKMIPVSVIFSGELEEGVHPFSHSIANLENNEYFLRLKSESQSSAKKIQIKHA
ncbi:MAG: hypothetical protein ACK4K0_09745 [Flavobacteriales bacterium]